MNRRTFIALTGMTTIGMPISAIAKQKPTWIPLTERSPKPGQKVIITGRMGPYHSLKGGLVVDERYPTKFKSNFASVPMIRDFEKRDHENGSVYHTYATKWTKLVESRKWLKSKGLTWLKQHKKDNTKSQSFCHTLYRKTYYFWMPVDGEYPETLPPIPEAKHQWTLFSERTPTHDDYIEIQDQAGDTAKGWFAYTTNLITKEKSQVFVPDQRKMYLKEGPCYYKEINIPHWSWRYVS